MSNLIIWQQNSNNPENGDNLTLIKQWWEELNTQEIVWQQRLIPDSTNLEEINWDEQRFDEKIKLNSPQIRGITLYWHQSGINDERSITPRKLELDTTYKQLYIYPQSQPQLLIRIAKIQTLYERIEIENPLIVGTAVGENYVLLLRDKQQQLEVKLTLNSQSLSQLLESLPKE